MESNELPLGFGFALAQNPEAMRNFANKMLKHGILTNTGQRPADSGPKIPVKYTFNKDKYDEMKSKGFRLEF